MKKQVFAIVGTLTLSFGIFTGSVSAKILRNYDFALTELQQLNQLKSINYMAHSSFDEDVQQEEDTHRIQSGDTLFNISNKYDVTVEELRLWNNIPSNVIVVGETIAVKASSAKLNKTVSDDGQKYTMRATAYTAYCTGCSGITANGTDLRTYPNQKVIAVDPRVIPLGTKVWVEGYGEAIAADTGGAIKGNKIDVFIPTDGQARNWGVRTVTVKILN